MWCIGELTVEYRRRMYDLLDLYARPYHANEPVICLDEKSNCCASRAARWPPSPMCPARTSSGINQFDLRKAAIESASSAVAQADASASGDRRREVCNKLRRQSCPLDR
jgi:hypothetical protein